MPLPGLWWIGSVKNRSLFGQIFVSDDTTCWFYQIGMRIESRVKKSDSHAFACETVISIQPDVHRNNGKTIGGVLVIVFARIHVEFLPWPSFNQEMAASTSF